MSTEQSQSSDPRSNIPTTLEEAMRRLKPIFEAQAGKDLAEVAVECVNGVPILMDGIRQQNITLLGCSMIFNHLIALFGLDEMPEGLDATMYHTESYKDECLLAAQFKNTLTHIEALHIDLTL